MKFFFCGGDENAEREVVGPNSTITLLSLSSTSSNPCSPFKRGSTFGCISSFSSSSMSSRRAALCDYLSLILRNGDAFAF